MLDRKSGWELVTGVQTYALPISIQSTILYLIMSAYTFIQPPALVLPAKTSTLKVSFSLNVRSEERLGASDWSSDVCSSDLDTIDHFIFNHVGIHFHTTTSTGTSC